MQFILIFKKSEFTELTFDLRYEQFSVVTKNLGQGKNVVISNKKQRLELGDFQCIFPSKEIVFWKRSGKVSFTIFQY